MLFRYAAYIPCLNAFPAGCAALKHMATVAGVKKAGQPHNDVVMPAELKLFDVDRVAGQGVVCVCVYTHIHVACAVTMPMACAPRDCVPHCAHPTSSRACSMPCTTVCGGASLTLPRKYSYNILVTDTYQTAQHPDLPPETFQSVYVISWLASRASSLFCVQILEHLARHIPSSVVLQPQIGLG